MDNVVAKIGAIYLVKTILEALSAVSGVAPTTIRLIETNTSDRQNSVRLSTLISLAQALNVKVKDLFEEVKE